MSPDSKDLLNIEERTYVENALEAATKMLQPGEQIHSVGNTVYSYGNTSTITAMIGFGSVFAIAAISLLFSRTPFLNHFFSAIFILSVILLFPLAAFLLLAPLMDISIKRTQAPIEEIYIITNQRIFSVRSKSFTLTNLGKKAEIATFKTEKGLLVITLINGTIFRIKPIDGLILPT